MQVKRPLLLIGLCLAIWLCIGPGAERVEAATAAGQCAAVYDWVVTYVEPYRGHLLRIIVRDPMSSEYFPLVGYWITTPENWVKAPRHLNAIVRGCQETPGGSYTVEVQTEEGTWVSGRGLRVRKLSTDWHRISITILADPDEPSSVIIERIIEIPK